MSGKEPAPQMAPVEYPQMVSSVKLHILKKGEYTLWSMRMEQYLTNTDYGLWQVITNGDEPVQTTRDVNGIDSEVPPNTAQAILARQRKRKAKIILLLAIPDEYQLRFHTIKDSKSLWAAIKKGLHKAYDRFQKLISLLENKEGIDELDINDLYNNLKVFKADIKGSSGSSLNSQNVAFLSAEDNNSINEVNTANGVSTTAGHISSGQPSLSSYIDDMMFSFFANQSNSPQLDDEDIEQIDQDDLEEMDLKWQRQTLNKANLEILAYQLGLESVKVQLIVHQKNEASYEEKIIVLEFKVRDKGNASIRLTNQLDKTLKEKKELNAKLEQFKISSKNLNKLINSQLSAKDKTGVGYKDQLSDNDIEVLPSVFDSRSSDGDDNPRNDRFKKDDGYHAILPLFTGNYMSPLADLSFAGLDDFVYRPTANKVNASISKDEPSVINSNISVEMPKVDYVKTSGVIIKDWVSDDEDTLVDTQVGSQTTVKPSLKRLNLLKLGMNL
nr:hypothetical protein [Tanacetum cinerariifolium]